MSSPAAAVIDIGSNTIKALIAVRETTGNLRALGFKTIDARISAGISRAQPRLTEEGMARGLAAVQELLGFVAPHQPHSIQLVATSAVRDAVNGEEFRARVLAATGHRIRILTGDEEANLIGRGLTVDPALQGLRDFSVFDLGGGSLECLIFRDRQIQHGLSLPLGCVRLTEQFVPNPAAPLAEAELLAVRQHVTAEIRRNPLPFDRAAAAVFTGGTMTAARLILAAESNRPVEDTPARVSVAELRRIERQVSTLPLADRQQVRGLPAPRADVFPVALATMIAVAELIGTDAFQHSFYNLRWGIVDTLLPS